MGWRYFSFRSGFEVKRKLGILKQKYPINPTQQYFIALDEWKNLPIKYFFSSKTALTIPKNPNNQLKQRFDEFIAGKIAYFNASTYHIGRDYDWITNPSNNYKYPVHKHWLDIPDFSEETGDIKYVWEKSRFSYLYDIIRYDYHFGEDCAELVFKEIESWIENNPINQGPNWRCSQEISLRTLNWLFALYYYKDAAVLNDALFQKIMHVIYWQLKHVRANINFSRIAVRNNHAITETLMLYLGGLMLSFFPEAEGWKKLGKKWFEEEVAYQVYDDGTFLQFSHNYHRVLIQLFTVGFNLAALNGESFKEITYEKASKSLNYLYQCINEKDGHLPNYGANDGALFFKLNNCEYRDYRPQLNALAYILRGKVLFSAEYLLEDIYWLGSNPTINQEQIVVEKQNIIAFENGGYYLIKDDKTLTFIKCGSYKDRPSHADNLHIDIWYHGENMLRDAGTYRYNSDKELVHYFNGTKAHNTVTLGDYDQMQKGPRFIWLNWSQAEYVKLEEKNDAYYFEGQIRAFQYIDRNIKHKRSITKFKDKVKWLIEDELQHNTNLPIYQYWNVSPNFEYLFQISAIDDQGIPVSLTIKDGYYSGLYGQKDKTKVFVFETCSKKLQTTIQLK